MQISKEQLDRFIRLYKEELGLEITREEALQKAQSLVRLLQLTVPTEEEDHNSQILF